MTLTNIGPDAASGIQVSDGIPAGLTDVIVTPSGTTTYTGGVWSINSLAASGMETLTITGVVVANGTTLTNTAEVTASDQADPDSTNNLASASVTVVLPQVNADLSLNKTVDDARPNVGDEVVFTVTINNQGPDAATGIEVTEVLSDGLMFVDASLESYDSGSGVWTVGSLAVGQTQTLMITAEVAAAGPASNIASVTASDQPDPDSSDNQATVTVTPQVADLSLVKTVDDLSASVGDDVTFTIAVNNAGPDTATGVTVTDQLPAGLQFIDATGAGSYDEASGVWTIGSVAADSTVTLDIVATLTGQSVENVAQVATSDQFDPNSTPGNNIPEEDDQFSVSLGACLTIGELTAGENLFTYSCVTPGGFASFVMGKQPGSHLFETWGSTVDIADPEVFAIGVGNIDGIAFGLLELTEEQASEIWHFQAFEMVPSPAISNVLTPNITPAPVGVPLHAKSVGSGAAAVAASSLPPLFDEAIARWEEVGLSTNDSRLLRSLDVRTSDLPGDQLASSHGNFVLVDRTAAGHGWFVDSTPDEDAEFLRDADGTLVATGAAATDQIDVLTALMHEIGHVLGQDDVADGVTGELMSHVLPVGVRRLPTSVYDPLDTNRDGKVSSLDALVIINQLSREQPIPQATSESLTGKIDQVLMRYDVNDDGRVSALDALNVINHLSRATVAAEAESEQESSVDLVIPSLPILSSHVESLENDDLLRMLADDNINARLATFS